MWWVLLLVLEGLWKYLYLIQVQLSVLDPRPGREYARIGTNMFTSFNMFFSRQWWNKNDGFYGFGWTHDHPGLNTESDVSDERNPTWPEMTVYVTLLLFILPYKLQLLIKTPLALLASGVFLFCWCVCVCYQNISKSIYPMNFIFGGCLPSGPKMEWFNFERNLSGVRVNTCGTGT